LYILIEIKKISQLKTFKNSFFNKYLMWINFEFYFFSQLKTFKNIHFFNKYLMWIRGINIVTDVHIIFGLDDLISDISYYTVNKIN